MLFLHLSRWSYDFFPTILSFGVVHILIFLMLNCPYMPGIYPIWSWYMCCWVQFTNFCFENFAIYIHQGYTGLWYFSYSVSVWNLHQGNAGLIKWAYPVPSSSIIWRSLSRIDRLPWWLSSNDSACNAGDAGLTPGLGRSPGGGNGNALWYSCLRNPWTEEHGRWRLKICITWELRIKFYLGQNGACSLGDSISDISERLLQSDKGEEQYIRLWWRGSSVLLNTHFTKGFLLVMKIWCHHEGI